MTFFFFQAEDGIRDYKVTGVQTCALPILFLRDITTSSAVPRILSGPALMITVSGLAVSSSAVPRSEEHTSELQSPCNLVCRLLLEKKKNSSEFSFSSRPSVHSVSRTY